MPPCGHQPSVRSVYAESPAVVQTNLLTALSRCKLARFHEMRLSAKSRAQDPGRGSLPEHRIRSNSPTIEIMHEMKMRVDFFSHV
jgi:hypothetical protein